MRVRPEGLVFYKILITTKLLKGKLTTKSDEYTLSIVDKFGNPKSISSKVADFNKEVSEKKYF